MALREKLETIREMAKARIPPEARATMERSIEQLRASGIMTHVAKVGQPAPDFSLPNAEGQEVSLKALLARGPVVLSFFAGAGDRTATRSWRLCSRPCPRLRPAAPPSRPPPPRS